MHRSWFHLFTAGYLLAVLALTIFTYTQVDLNLTLSSNSLYQSVQRPLTRLGYFNRPLSTTIFFIILSALVLCYLLLVTNHAKWKLSHKQIWILILSISFLLLFSYPAFAHDIFNYMFDARTVIKHHQNPYVTTPLDFPLDEWTRFMRWTHVSSVYPPGWLIASAPFYILGFGKFTLTLLSFKLLGLISFIASSWLMLRLGGKKVWVLWSLNPMILIESLSSVHNEITMVAFSLLALNLFKQTQKNYPGHLTHQNIPSLLLAYFWLIFAGLIKYTSFLLIPFLHWSTWVAVAAWVGAVVFFYVREVNPWYIMLPVAVSLIGGNSRLVKIALFASLVIMYRYYPCVAIFSC